MTASAWRPAEPRVIRSSVPWAALYWRKRAGTRAMTNEVRIIERVFNAAPRINHVSHISQTTRLSNLYCGGAVQWNQSTTHHHHHHHSSNTAMTRALSSLMVRNRSFLASEPAQARVISVPSPAPVSVTQITTTTHHSHTLEAVHSSWPTTIRYQPTLVRKSASNPPAPSMLTFSSAVSVFPTVTRAHHHHLTHAASSIQEPQPAQQQHSTSWHLTTGDPRTLIALRQVPPVAMSWRATTSAVSAAASDIRRPDGPAKVMGPAVPDGSVTHGSAPAQNLLPPGPGIQPKQEPTSPPRAGLDPSSIDRLTGEVIRRIERKARIERERRGLS